MNAFSLALITILVLPIFGTILSVVGDKGISKKAKWANITSVAGITLIFIGFLVLKT